MDQQILSEIIEIKEKLAGIEVSNQELQLQLAKKKGISLMYEEDENKERGNWSGKCDFFLSCLGYAVGFGNIWRFPYLAYKNGGGAFLIPYFVFLLIVGLPIFLMELSLGQFTSCGPLTCWSYAPLFKGLGVGMMLVAFYYSIYYNVLIAWSLYYFFASFTSKLPWSECGSWSSEFCATKLSTCYSNHTNYANGTCYENVTINGTSTMKLRGIYNNTLAREHGIESKTATAEYVNYVSLTDKLGTFENLGPIRWDMALSLLGSWLIVFFCLIRGIKSSGKVVYFTALFPYVVLIVLFIRMFFLEGYVDGILYLVTPNFEKLKDATVWRDACVQIFFTLSASESGLIALASYNRFHTDVVRDTILIPACNCLTSLFASCIIFGYLGYLSSASGIAISQLGDQGGSTLAFIVYPHALTLLPLPPLFSVLFFLMLITLGLDSQFTLVEALVTGIVDQFSSIRRFKSLVILVMSIVLFLLGLTMTTNGGAYMLTFIDNYAGGWNVMIISFLECISVAYIYGVTKFCNNIRVMTGDVVAGCIPWFVFKFWWIACWCCLTPLLLLAIFVYSFVGLEPLTYGSYTYPTWSLALGWLMTSSVVLAILVTAIVMIILEMRRSGKSFGRAFLKTLKPSEEWGPALQKHRDLVNDEMGESSRQYTMYNNNAYNSKDSIPSAEDKQTPL